MKATASHLYGNRFCETPAMERLAERGVLYTHAFTPHPLCVPARISLWTSQYPHSHGGRRNQTLMPQNATHAFQIWKHEGYHCGLIGKNHCFETPQDLDLFDTWMECSHGGLEKGTASKGMDWIFPIPEIEQAHAGRNSLPNQTPAISYGVTDAPLEKYASGLLAGQAIRFLEEHRDDPFALWLSFPDTHAPFEAPRQYAEMFPSDKLELPESFHEHLEPGIAPERNRVLQSMVGIQGAPPHHVHGILSGYYGMLRFLDDSLGRVLDALERLGLSERTIVVFCSDHGDFVGEHGMMHKGGALYDCLTRVPLLVSWPGRLPEGEVDDSMVNLVDIIPTLLELQGLSIPRSMHGQALPTVTNAPPREATFSEYGAGGELFGWRELERMANPRGMDALMTTLQQREAAGRLKMLRTRQWKYIHDPMGDLDELYNMVEDPHEMNNLAAKPEHKERLLELKGMLADWSIATEDARPVPLPAAPAMHQRTINTKLSHTEKVS